MKKKINFGVIGCGMWGKMHALIYKQNQYSNLVAVCDLDVDAAKDLAEKYSVNYYTDYQEMLDKEAIDAVGIATPDFAHGEPLIACIKKNKHILCEKPLTTDKDELDQILQTLDKKPNIRIMTDYHNRWNPFFASAKQNVLDGDIGEPVYGYMRLNDKIFVPKTMLKWSEKSSIMWFLGSHTVDTLMWMFNDRIKKVYSLAKSGVLNSININAADVYLTTAEFEKGYIAQLENGWITPDSTPFVNDFKFSMVGTKGMINLDLSSSSCYQVYDENHIKQPDFFIKNFVHGKLKGFSFESINDFIEKLYFDEEFIVSFEESVYVNKVLFAILESAVKGVPIFVQ